MSQSERDQLYRAVFELNTAIKLVIDPADGQIVDANPAAVAFYGWSVETLRTMRIHDINTLTSEQVAAEMDNARSMRRSYFRFHHRTASGEVRAVEVHAGPLRFDGRDLLLSIIHDITERDQLEEQLRRSQRLEALGQLAGGVAHDFNNLLTVVMSASQLARRRPGDVSRFLDEIDEAAERGAALTQQLLAFGRRQVMMRQPVVLADIVERLVPLLTRSLGPSYPLELRTSPAPAVLADPARLEQVVMNLVLNARDAMPVGGTIVIEIGTVGDRVRLAVIDRGVGMDAGTRSRVFEPFFTTKPDGTGMGLASVYGIVAQSGGEITVDSAPGRGSTFSVLLPATGEVAAPAQASPQTPELRAITVLVVDDLEAVRETLGEMLRDHGHTVITAASYDDALRVAAHRLATIDVLLTDAVMPGRSGSELIRDLRALRPSLGCILMSGDLRDQVTVELPAGVVRLAKPFGFAALSAALAGLIE
jgi:two-component system cell cycle sensor histidine kinase/response regulator CckA